MDERRLGGVVSERILFVDDEVNILDAVRRVLRRAPFEIVTAVGGEEAIELMGRDPDFGVIVTDMRMPGTDGVAVLARARELVPDAVQMVLSGQADLTSTIAAVNEGEVFRFLTKPVKPAALQSAIDAALEVVRARRVEHELLSQTLSAAVVTLSEIAALATPGTFQLTAHTRSVVEFLAPRRDLADDWELRLAAALAHIGCAAVPAASLDRVWEGSCTPEERAAYDEHVEVSARLLARIPRLDGVAELVAATGADPAVALEDPRAEILRLACRLAEGALRGEPIAAQLRRLRGVPADLADALSGFELAGHWRTGVVGVWDLALGMVLAEEVRSLTGVLLARAGTPVTETLLERLLSFHRRRDVDEPLAVYVRADDATA